ncbi:hypothetical protein YTPLAS18_36480 [Nitrospira sp.]|nr:hypothetical protein YTPLAS18_36480 [Nitrospira sp.]
MGCARGAAERSDSRGSTSYLGLNTASIVLGNRSARVPEKREPHVFEPNPGSEAIRPFQERVDAERQHVA